LRNFLNGGNGKATIKDKQKQQALIEFLLLEGRESENIVLRLQHASGRDAYCRASGFKYMNEIRHGNEELRNEGRRGIPYRYERDAALRSILRDDPNASSRTRANTFSISPEMVRTHMSRSGYTPKSLRWISHALTSEQKQVRFNLCLHLLPKLRVHAHDNWRHLVTGMTVGFITNMFGTGYVPHEMRACLKWRTGPLPPRKLC
jgi:hypothetical protein